MPKFSGDFIERWGGHARIAALPLSEPALLSRGYANWANAESRYWREWAQPLGICDIMALGMLRDATAVGSIILARHDSRGPIDEETIALGRTILPHAQRSIAISRVLETHRLGLASFRAAMDQLSTAITMLGESRAILYANRAALDLFASSSPLTRQKDRLGLGQSELDRRLGGIVRASAQSMSPGADIPL
ncbi:PAS domain-containing protein [Paracoccus ravus]|uniref:PAS domain-containing protein n=1 Tax=Paracoccus ravus TaxID=2447760 RepID=UPI00106E3D45|nr:hypothetical protein [Paracoccus ravus]